MTLSLDRQALIDVIPLAERQAAPLRDLDVGPYLTSNLNAVKAACGSGWQSAGFTPACPEGWTTADLGLWRLLTLTPDNADLTCTSAAGLEELADLLSPFGLLDDVSDLLGGILGIGTLAEVLATSDVAAALEDDLLATHPAVNMDGTLPITLQDALTDLGELPLRFGSQEGHPGVLDPGEATSAVLLGESFAVTMDATDHRLWHEGLDLCGGKQVVATLAGGASTRVDFDFDTLGVSGLESSPTVDLVLRLDEDSGYVAAHTRSNSESAPAPPPDGPGALWQLSPWVLEYVLVDTASRRYAARTGYSLYEDPIFTIDEAAFAIGVNDGDDHFPTISNQPGWWRTWSLLTLSDPPQAQFLDEAVTEIEQARLHVPSSDCTTQEVAEGDADAAIRLSNVSVALTDQQLLDAVEPLLVAHQDALVDQLDAPPGVGTVDVFLAGTTDDLYLFFVIPADIAPRPYLYDAPGFFADPGLEVKVSTTASLGSGDTVHEKIALTTEPQTVYARDNFGEVQRIDIAAALSESVTVTLVNVCQAIFVDGVESGDLSAWDGATAAEAGPAP